jgi:molecular chaperone DnaK (HSP70)
MRTCPVRVARAHSRRIFWLLLLQYSCVGVWRNNAVDIIANEQGNRTTPSYVGFADNERLLGDAAKNQAAENATNTVFDASELLLLSYLQALTCCLYFAVAQSASLAASTRVV